MQHTIRSVSLLPIGMLMMQSVQAETQTERTQQNAGLEEVIVTAQRREENLQKTSIAVSAVTAEELNAKVNAAEDISKLVPSVVIGAGGGGTNFTTIRGVGNLSAIGLSEQTVALNLDGIYLARGAAGNGLFYDLARIEVLKGPQGTLYGRNASAGAINVITNSPVFENGGYVDVKVGNYAHYEAQGAINVKLADNAALRFAGQSIRHDGYLTDGSNDQKQYSGRVSLRVDPTDAVSFQLTTDYVHMGGKGAGGVWAPQLDSSQPFLGLSNPIINGILSSITIFGPNGLPLIKTDSFNDSDFFGINGIVTVKTDAGDLTVIPGYRKTDLQYFHYDGGFPLGADDESNQKSLEVRFATPTAHRFNAVIGGYYFHETGNYQLDAFLFNEPGAPGLGPETTHVDGFKTQSTAFFGQGTFKITDAVRLIGGVRYTKEKKSVDGVEISAFGGPPAPINGDLDFNKVNWRAGIEADVAPDSMVYGTVATGFKAGGFFAAPAPNTFLPEQITAYTVGSKNRFLDNRLQLNLEGYYWKYKDKQVDHQLNNLLVTENAGKATIYGLEIEASAKPTQDDLVSINVLLNHTKYDHFVFELPQTAPWNCARTPAPTPGNDMIDCSGHELQQSPKTSINLSYEHSFRFGDDSRVVFGALGNYRSSYWLSDEQIDGELQGASFVADLDLTYKAAHDRWYVGAYVRNVGDKAVKQYAYVQSFVGMAVAGVYPPRTYGLQGGVTF